MKKKRSICVLLAVLIATAYLIYVFTYFMENADTTAGAIATAVVLPHMAVLAIGVLFGWIGYFTRGTGFILTSAILYSVAAILFVMYAVFLIPSIVLGFVGYVRQKKLNG